MSIRQGNKIIAGTPDASSVKIDNITLTENQAGDTQAVALVDRNTGYVKTWTGTQAEYDAIEVKDPNTLYNVEDDEKAHDSSIGLDIGDIGFAPLGIDETQNKRRYLNGQVISQAQFVSFTAKVKNAILLYPSLSATEENWQAEVTNSKLGQCGKFVIDDELGTIRLPKVVNINGLSNLSLIGSIKAESLPNITGDLKTYVDLGRSTGSGAIRRLDDGGDYIGTSLTAGERYAGFSFDASLSSSTYQNNAPVQQEAVQYPYFIQVATGVEDSIDVTREIELNNPFSLLDYKWSEYEITNVSWLLSNGAFHSGATYVSVYELLLKIKNGTEIKDGVSVKLSTEAYKDTDFVLNTAETTFRLPIRTKDDFVVEEYNNGTEWYRVYKSGWVEQGGFIQSAGTSTINFIKPFKSAVYSVYLTLRVDAVEGSYAYASKVRSVSNSSCTVYNNAGAFWRACGQGSKTPDSKTYFYVGETVQDASVINASGVLTEIANADYVVERYNDGTNWYRVYKSGWVEQGGKTSNFTNTAASTSDPKTVSLLKEMKDNKYSVSAVRAYNASIGNGSVSGYSYREIIVSIVNTKTIKVDQFTNQAASGTSCYAEWEVKGQGAE